MLTEKSTHFQVELFTYNFENVGLIPENYNRLNIYTTGNKADVGEMLYYKPVFTSTAAWTPESYTAADLE